LDFLPRLDQMGFCGKHIPKADAHHHPSLDPRSGEVRSSSSIDCLDDRFVQHIAFFAFGSVGLIPEADNSHGDWSGANEGLIGVDPGSEQLRQPAVFPYS